jgi:hypothetical protein
MFTAINKETKEIVNSIYIGLDGSYQDINAKGKDIWIADPDNITNWDDIKEKYSEIKVVYIPEKRYENFKHTPCVISGHFRIPNKNKLGINIIPESKEHKIAKNWIYQQLLDKKLLLSYSYVTKPFRYVNPVSLDLLPIDTSKICIETTVNSLSKSRIADVICPFLKKDDLFGNGIVFEIQFSRQRDKTKEERNNDWVIKGYSVCWIEKEDIDYIDDNVFILNKDTIDILVFAGLLKKLSKDQIKNLSIKIQDQCRLIDEKIKISNKISNQITTFIENMKILTQIHKDELIQFKEKQITDIKLITDEIIKDKLKINMSEIFKETEEKVKTQISLAYVSNLKLAFERKIENIYIDLEEKLINFDLIHYIMNTPCPNCNQKCLIYQHSGISKAGKPYKSFIACQRCNNYTKTLGI